MPSNRGIGAVRPIGTPGGNHPQLLKNRSLYRIADFPEPALRGQMQKRSPHTLAVRMFACLCLALFLIGCGNTSANSKQKSGPGGKGGRGGGQFIIPVAVAKVEVRDLPVV